MVYSVEELIKLTNKRKCKYVFFWGHKSNAAHTTKTCFSQWFLCNFQGENGELYRSAEHYMMVQKAKLFGNEEMAEKILQCSIPAKAKAYGRMIEPFDQ